MVTLKKYLIQKKCLTRIQNTEKKIHIRIHIFIHNRRWILSYSVSSSFCNILRRKKNGRGQWFENRFSIEDKKGAEKTSVFNDYIHTRTIFSRKIFVLFESHGVNICLASNVYVYTALCVLVFLHSKWLVLCTYITDMCTYIKDKKFEKLT